MEDDGLEPRIISSKHKKPLTLRHGEKSAVTIMEVRSGIEPLYEVLQTSA